MSMKRISVVSLTPVELAALHAVVRVTLDQGGDQLKAKGPECYEALVNAELKLSRLACAEHAMVSA